MGSAFGENEHSKVFVSLVLIGTILSAAASILMLILIYRLKRRNGHVLLVSTMTFFTLVYDITFFPGVVNLGNRYVTITANCLQLFSGITTSLISNLVASITYYVVNYRKSFDIYRYYSSMMAFVMFPGVIDCIIFVISVQKKSLDYLSDVAILIIYYYLKMISIVFNFIIFTLTALEIRRIASGKEVLSKQEQALNALSMRLFYYPIIQSISRSGCAWYELAYTYDHHSSDGFDLNPPHTSNQQFAAQVFMAITMPIGSIGYLIIFLLMQPKAFQELQLMFGCITKEQIEAEERKELLSSFDQAMGFSNSMVFSQMEDDNESLLSYESESHLRFSLLQSVDEERSISTMNE